MNGLTTNTRSFTPPEQLRGLQCSICLKDFDIDKRPVTTTECHHTFDSDCLADWLTKKTACPVCYKMLSSRSVSGASQAVVSEAPVCAVCQQCLNEPVSITPCDHRFHSKCLSRWSHENLQPVCPLCRGPIPLPESRLAGNSPFPHFLAVRKVDLLEEDCPICNQSLIGRDVTGTCCLHDFHSECLSTWLRSPEGSPSCPVCRTSLPQRVFLERLNSRNNQDALDLLATPFLAAEGAVFRNTHCQICQSPFKGLVCLLRTVCGHDFHMDCLKRVFTQNLSLRSYSCPHCLTPLVVPAPMRLAVARDATNDSTPEAISSDLPGSESRP